MNAKHVLVGVALYTMVANLIPLVQVWAGRKGSIFVIPDPLGAAFRSVQLNGANPKAVYHAVVDNARNAFS